MGSNRPGYPSRGCGLPQAGRQLPADAKAQREVLLDEATLWLREILLQRPGLVRVRLEEDLPAHEEMRDRVEQEIDARRAAEARLEGEAAAHRTTRVRLEEEIAARDARIAELEARLGSGSQPSKPPAWSRVAVASVRGSGVRLMAMRSRVKASAMAEPPTQWIFTRTRFRRSFSRVALWS